MKFGRMGLLTVLVSSWSTAASAAEPAPLPAVAEPAADETADEPDADAAPQWISLQDLQERLLRAEEMTLNRAPTLQWSGYIDAGFFAPQGNGSGYVQDFGHALHPNEPFGWVFLGDILAPAVNSRGEAADLGVAPGVERYDGIHSRGAPGFILNETNLSLRAAIRPTAIATASLNITPRTGSNFHLGDLLDLDLAQVEWLPTDSQKTSIFVGKIESVIGIEYRDRKANRRFGITPSLIARYTTEPALGIKVRSKFGPDDLVVVAAALTNGSNTSERFHYYDETDSNAGKTASGRLSIRLPVPGSLEIGASGSYGSQDRARTSDGIMWFAGPDLLARFGAVDIKAQWLTGKAPGSDIDQVYGLHLKGGGYLEVNWMINSTFGVLARGEYRQARVWLGDERLYLTQSWRATGGVRAVLAPGTALKAEYLHNGEFGKGYPAVRNDVFTSSLVLSF